VSKDELSRSTSSDGYESEWAPVNRLLAQMDVRPLRGSDLVATAIAAKKGDEAAVLRMLGAVARFTCNRIRRYAHWGIGHAPSDYFTNAMWTLQRSAIPKYDPERGAWTTYAGNWIRASVNKLSHQREVHHPTLGTYGYGPYCDMVAKRLRCDPKDAFKIAFWLVRLDTPTNNTQGQENSAEQQRLIDRIESRDPLPDQRLANRIGGGVVLYLRESGEFTARDVYIYFRRFRDEAALQVIGGELGVSRERIRQLENGIKRQLEDGVRRDAITSRHFLGDCVGWPKECHRKAVRRSGHCRACWKRLREDAGVTKKQKHQQQAKVEVVVDGAKMVFASAEDADDFVRIYGDCNLKGVEIPSTQ